MNIDIIWDNIRIDGYFWGARFNVSTYSKVISRDILPHPLNPSWHPYLWVFFFSFLIKFSFLVWWRFQPVLWEYPVRRVKTGGFRSGSCNPDLSWHQLVEIGIRTRPWKKCIDKSRIGIGIVKKYFWKNSVMICMWKSWLVKKLISRLNLIINY
jgi:hypothetical protein